MCVLCCLAAGLAPSLHTAAAAEATAAKAPFTPGGALGAQPARGPAAPPRGAEEEREEQQQTPTIPLSGLSVAAVRRLEREHAEDMALLQQQGREKGAERGLQSCCLAGSDGDGCKASGCTFVDCKCEDWCCAKSKTTCGGICASARYSYVISTTTSTTTHASWARLQTLEGGGNCGKADG